MHPVYLANTNPLNVLLVWTRDISPQILVRALMDHSPFTMYVSLVIYHARRAWMRLHVYHVIWVEYCISANASV